MAADSLFSAGDLPCDAAAWQLYGRCLRAPAYSGETAMSYFTQMAGLAYHNFVSAAVERSMSEDDVRRLVRAHTEGRQFGFFGEPRVNVLELNLALDAKHPIKR